MRHLALLAALALGARAVAAQEPDTTRGVLSYDDAAEVAFLFNGAAAIRTDRALTIAARDTVDGNVAVLRGPARIAGTVHGRVVMVNGTLTVEPSAHIDGDVIVTGATPEIDSAASIGGKLVVHPERMRFRREDDLIVAVAEEAAESDTVDTSWFRRWKRRHLRTQNRFTIRGGTYNRVEGLPVMLGPTVRQNTEIGQLRASVLGIYRSADNFRWTGANFGYDAGAELQFGRHPSITVGGRVFDVVNAVEDWQLKNSEIGLASFFLHRDYRDYYNTKGARGYVGVAVGHGLSLGAGFSNERWEPRAARDPFTLLHNHNSWRPNPLLDAARMQRVDASLDFDTRNNAEDPRTGWLISADLEHGWSDEVTLGPTDPLVRAPALAPVRVRYTRLFADARRYNRMGPQGQLNLRLVLGARLGGDPLPLERRFSLGGAGSLPGYDFRQRTGGADVLSCNGSAVAPGTPALCERMVLGMAEYRHDFLLRLFRHGEDSRYLIDRRAAWVLFTDAGRGWLVGARSADERYPSGELPSLRTFKTDAGLGLDLHWLGIYVAKSLSDWDLEPNLVVRLRHRF